MDFMNKDEKFRRFVKNNIENYSLKEASYKTTEHEEINKIYNLSDNKLVVDTDIDQD